HSGAHAAARRRAGDDDAVAAQEPEIAQHVGTEKSARLLLAHDDVLRRRRDLVDDVVAVAIDAGHARPLGIARILPRPAAGIPAIVAAETGGVDHRQALLMRPIDQLADIADRHPAFLAAGVAPFLDRIEDRLRLLAAERVIDVDDEQRGLLAEALMCAVSRLLENRLVAVGQEFRPDRFRHVAPQLSFRAKAAGSALPARIMPRAAGEAKPLSALLRDFVLGWECGSRIGGAP